MQTFLLTLIPKPRDAIASKNKNFYVLYCFVLLLSTRLTKYNKN